MKITVAGTVTGREIRVATTTSSVGLNPWRWDLCSKPQPGAGRGGRGVAKEVRCPGGGRMAPEGTYPRVGERWRDGCEHAGV